MAEEKKAKRKKHIVSNIALVIAATVFLYSAYQLVTIFMEYNKGEQEYKEILDEVITEVPETDNQESQQPQVTPEEPEKRTEHKVLKVDFKKLQSTNPDTVAWISFDEPAKINYPVVRANDNDKYLKSTFEGKKNASGAIFMDAVNSGDFSNTNTFIYGHNMKNGSMFGQLRKYKNEAFYREYPFFYIYMPDGREVKYQIFAVGIVEDASESYRKHYMDDADYLKYLQYIQSISKYKTGVEVTAESDIVSLSTCTNVTETQRLLVHGVKVSEKMVGE
jgi:sortase B